MTNDQAKKTLADWGKSIREDERQYLLKLLESIKNGECDETGTVETMDKKPSIVDAMTRAERIKADNQFLASLGIEPFSA